MKKLLSFLLALAVLFSLVPCAFAAETVGADEKFIDVPDNAWYLSELNYALANGYISGTSATTFSPDANITRGQFVTILGRMLGVSTASGETRFTDVDAASWYAPYVAWAAENGYVNGTSSTTFSPDDNITVEQMGTILANYITKSGAQVHDYNSFAGYEDASSISSWAVSSMEMMREYDLLVIDGDGNVHPHKAVNRAEGTVSLVRLAQLTGLGEMPTLIDKPVEPVSSSGDVFSRFILDDPQLITSFKNSDEAAWESNIGYMLKHGLSELELTIEFVGYGGSEVGGTVSTSWGVASLMGTPLSKNNYTKSVGKYSYLGCAYDLSWGGTNDSVQSRTLRIVRPYNDNIVMDSLTKAVEVHDALWASGQITSAMTQKEKARVYYDWIISHCEYDYDYTSARDNLINDILNGGGLDALFAGIGNASNAPTAHGALVDGKDVCEGYTNAYDLFLRLEGIDCGAVVSLYGDHAWNTVMLDGTLYHIDTTWGDTTGQPDKYFCMTEEAAWARFGGYEKELEYLQSLDWPFGD